MQTFNTGRFRRSWLRRSNRGRKRWPQDNAPISVNKYDQNYLANYWPEYHSKLVLLFASFFIAFVAFCIGFLYSTNVQQNELSTTCGISGVHEAFNAQMISAANLNMNSNAENSCNITSARDIIAKSWHHLNELVTIWKSATTFVNA